MAEAQMLSRQEISLKHQLSYERGWLVGAGFIPETWIDVWEERKDRQLLQWEARRCSVSPKAFILLKSPLPCSLPFVEGNRPGEGGHGHDSLPEAAEESAGA